MTANERRKVTVKLYPGNYESELADLLDRAMAAKRKEDAAKEAEGASGPQRAGQKSEVPPLAAESDRLAMQYDTKAAEAEAAGVEVVINEISNTAWQKLADEHPPREDDERDKFNALNMSTFPAALLKVALDPAASVDLDELSRVHYVKLERAAWNLHNGADEIPKESLVSLLNQQRDADSKPDSDTE